MKDLFIRIRNNMNIADFALMKVALISFGAIAGMFVPKKQKKKALTCVCAIYSISFGALLARIFYILLGNPGKDIEKN